MVSFEEARKVILSSVTPVGTERIHLLDAVGRVAAEDVAAPWDMPLWNNSAMDGYAVRSADCAATPATLRVSGFLPAGAKADGVRVEPGCAVRIMTGAPTPEGCDAVVPVEETDNGDREVTLNEPVQQGQHIRFRGEDVAAGVTFLRAGSVIRPPEVNMLASFGKALVPVYRRPTVAILSTGDELVELGATPGPGEIVNSNAISLAAAVREAGAAPLILGIARDTRASHLEKLGAGLKADVLITSAGVSAGDRDLVRDVLEELGARQVFWKVGIKPGGPTAFALHGTTPVFSLPGNPVSTMITFEEFVRPALLAMQGHGRVLRPLFKVVLRDEVRKKAGKVQIVRLRLEREEGRWYATSAGNQQTAILKTMVDAEAIAVLPAEATRFAAGDEVDAHFYGNHIDLLEAAP
ncbi:molybdopterin molybdotransferase MoeA [Geobacter sp. FeAm09]|uniref:molybdopterin molybdotransferase MoeA n=1 Tax=Geobacter sp. FeAm09 TaxID=2597769 RepID=UPI0011EF1792|nr:gephyrin-like molybdotransferase Glp [Geobacter sp. FeAm09]QEM69978.1 molybdopterin molybdotransferase MoeA [Geobacter sp. FeAm09]